MIEFKDLNISNQLLNALDDLGLKHPTPIQEQSYSVVLSGRNIIGIAQTGTGKTFAYALPILQDLKFSKEVNPTVLIIVPTRELVVQVVEQIQSLCAYKAVRVGGVYGGTNMKTHVLLVKEGLDIVVGTPGRLHDLVLAGALSLKAVKKLVIDEVDVMLDLGFLYQLTNIIDRLNEKRQNIMFSATMTEEVDELIEEFFYDPIRINIALSGTPLENIEQSAYSVPNFLTKVNLLSLLLEDAIEYSKVLIFAPSKRLADKLHEEMVVLYGPEMAVIHSNKSQNARLAAIEQFNTGEVRILIATDVIARGLDLDKISHVINFDTPAFPENYMHRIGRTGRAKSQGKSIVLYTSREEPYLEAIEQLMDFTIPKLELPEEVIISKELIPEEIVRPRVFSGRNKKTEPEGGGAFHEKKDKNKKVNLGSKYKREIKKKYTKPRTRGDKKQNLKRKNK